MAAKTDEDHALPWLKHHEIENNDLNRRLQNRLDSLPEDCLNAFAGAGIDVNGLSNSASTMHFWNSTRRGEGSLRISDIAGSNARDGDRPLFAAGMTGTTQPIATVLQQLAGNDLRTTNQVVLHQGLYNQTNAQQDWTLVHEALHVNTGISSDQQLMQNLQTGGRSVSQFLNDNCKK